MYEKTNTMEKEFQAVAARVSAVSIAGNIILSAIKFMAIQAL